LSREGSATASVVNPELDQLVGADAAAVQQFGSDETVTLLTAWNAQCTPAAVFWQGGEVVTADCAGCPASLARNSARGRIWPHRALHRRHPGTSRHARIGRNRNGN
jgi:hypothetical protein